MEDSELLQLFHQLKEGDRDAFDKLYRHTWRKLFDFALAKTKDEEEAKDIVQEVYTVLWDKKERIQIRLNVKAYLYRMTKHEVIRRLQASITFGKKEDIYRYAVEELSATLEDTLLAKELFLNWQKEVAKLPLKQKQIYLLHHELAYSVSEIASELGIAEQTVKNQLVTANKKIRLVMESCLLLASILIYH